MAQFMPVTTRWIAGAYPRELDAADPFNPTWAMRGLVRYDFHLWQRVTGANNCERMAFTLASYNGGLGWVQRDKKVAAAAGDSPATWFGQVERHNAGRSAAAFRENRGYPHQVLIIYEPLYKAAGFGPGACA
jgi:soluble lytic murein transglycosylase-like protein